MRIVHLFENVLLSFAIAACGGGNNLSPDAAPDAPPDVPPPTPTSITIDTSEQPPDLIAVRDGIAAPWQTIAGSGTTYSTTIHGPYFVAVVCDDKAGNITMWQVARLPSDAKLVDAPCFAAGTGGGALRKLTGTMVQPGNVNIGFFTSAESDKTNWPFTLTVGDGTYDLFAFATDGHILARRDLVVSKDAVLGKLTTAGGATLAPVALSATNAAPGESLRTVVQLGTLGGFFLPYFGASATAVVMPEALLLPTDRQRVSVRASLGSSARELRRNRFHVGDATAFTLPDPIGGASFTVANGVIVAHWATLPEHDSLRVDANFFDDATAASIFHELDISKAFADANATAPLDTDLPGMKPEWKIALTSNYLREIAAVRSTAFETATSRFFEDVNPPAGVAAGDAIERSAVRRARHDRGRE